MKPEERIRRALLELPMASNRKVSRIVGCEPKEVGIIRREMKARGEIKPIQVDEDSIDNNDSV